MIKRAGVYWVDFYANGDWAVGIRRIDVIAGMEWELWDIYAQDGQQVYGGSLAPDVERIEIPVPNAVMNV